MDCIARIFQAGLGHLRQGGWIFMEIGADLEHEVLHSIQALGGYDHIQVLSDWSGLPRVAQARKVR
jgi:methylase of polypeptide subunit release factors